MYDAAPVDVPISLLRDYGDTWRGEASALDEPFIEPEDRIRESYASPHPVFHLVRVDDIWYDDAAWPMDAATAYRFPIGAQMPSGTLEVMDDYRLVFDGSHA